MGVKGFPTLKIVKPGKKTGRPVVEDYNGPREAKDIVEAVSSKIANHVTKLADKDLEKYLKDHNDTAKAILFTNKGTINPMWKAVAIDFLGAINVAQIRDKESASVELFGITKFPTVILLPGGQTDAIVYDGELKKDAIVKFLSQVTPPNSDPAPKNGKSTSSKPNKKEKKSSAKAESSFKSASESHKSSEAFSAAASATDETIINDTRPTESPSPELDTESPVILDEKEVQQIALIPVLFSTEQLVDACLKPDAGTCVLAFVPTEELEAAVISVKSLSEIAVKYTHNKRNLFPFYTLPDSTAGATDLKKALGLTGPVDIVAINTKRGWMRKYSGSEYTQEPLESWIDAIRMGEGEKTVLPGVLLSKTPAATAPSPSTAESAPEATPEPEVEEPQAAEPLTQGEPADPEPQADPEATPDVDIPETVTGGTTTTTVTVEEAEQTKGHDEL